MKMPVQLDEKAFRNALGTFATGVTIVTTRGPDGEDVGLTANSFNSVSLDPPLVLWSLAKTSKSIEAFTQATHFAVHILAADQEPLSNQFAKRGIDKFAGVALERGEGGIPLIKGCGARFQCRAAYQYEGGDHVILVGEVSAFEHDQRDPLLFYKGRYALATQRGEENGAPDSAAICDDDLSHLLQRAYFYLLTPVRQQRERHGISLHEHYLMSVLMASGGKTVDQINDIIGYTGVISTPEIAEALVARSLVQKLPGAVGMPRLWLTPMGQRMMIEVIAAAKAMEADALLDFGEDEKRLLKRLVQRLLAGAERSVDERVGNHMDLLKQITNVRATVGQ
ncbi:flavin reductase [Noviherbaspirillum sedimenti]|uniref:Flavin reductase n=2 Tax=Noviherbaspirillum sedimenti TaxID=2320865 RepID=A0A3A3GA58_9BURK|nr:flavin reductase [Noviherbaspirillum sedimenti]